MFKDVESKCYDPTPECEDLNASVCSRSEFQAWAACTDSLTYKIMSEWAHSDVKRNWSFNYTKSGNPKIPGIIVYPPNITHENSEKYFGMGGIEPWSS